MILTFDTSLRDLHIGLFSDKAEPLAEFHGIASEGDRGIHDALLAQKTSDLLTEIHASPKEIKKIALIIGPGSFTGLRIGLSFAKGLAFGSKAKIFPLLAHKVLLEEYKKISDFGLQTSDFGLQTSDFGLLYPGYEKDSVYMSMASEPENIRYIKISELQKMNIKEAICPAELHLVGITQYITPISLKTMAEIASMTTLNPPSTIDSLEPFYGTDFKPTVK
jgi:tRNA threonylcarbamoyl adenosine modification protein YeaZ